MKLCINCIETLLTFYGGANEIGIIGIIRREQNCYSGVIVERTDFGYDVYLNSTNLT